MFDFVVSRSIRNLYVDHGICLKEPQKACMLENSENEIEKTVRMHRAGDRLFDRYVLKKRLGQGGMGIVWQALDERLEIDVALKVLPDSLRTNEGALSQLKHEAQKCVQLTHSRIVRVFDFIVTEDLAALSMEFVDGKTLTQLRAEKQDGVFSVVEIQGWVRQICEALTYAHTEAKIVHRDLKPSNVMIAVDGNVKVADFGISRSLEGTMTGPIMREMVTGTLSYMGPQQLNGDSPSVQDDIYALGSMIYEFLTSKPPFYSGDVFSQIEIKTPDLPTRRRESLGIGGEKIPEEWETTILRCLAKSDENRPKDLREVLDGLGLPKGALAGGGKQESWVHWLVGGLVVAVTLFFVFSSTIDTGAGGGRQEPIAPNVVPDLPVAAVEPMKPFTNSLGMPFVGIPGLNVGFAVYETRVSDFRAFVEAEKYDATLGMYRVILTEKDYEAHLLETGRARNTNDLVGKTFFGQLGGWESPGFSQTGSHPVVGMNVHDAGAFCKWLTEKERPTGAIGDGYEYTLPTDYEWSIAVGLTNELVDAFPVERLRRSGMAPYPWGDWDGQASKHGNYGGDEDGFEFTAPVGSFAPSRNGLYDMGGNVAEWCSDSYDAAGKNGVVRGAHHMMDAESTFALNSAWRNKANLTNPSKRHVIFGFRCVLRPVGN
ncbi:MAG: formylglycine-generating enzyme required for sulfatase activity/predicted Ser/Thr protein kinase [Limisphaerales bacterium]|jgi:formylglycine-generating enzyme required for sulfatase activity/predicted Ser/Thr protein kinase